VLAIAANHGRTTAARARANMSALFTWAMQAGLVESNPVIGSVNPEDGIAARDRTLSDAELRAVWNACNDDAFGRVVKMLVLTGCRRDEIGGLRWSEIDMASGTMSIPGSRTKGKKALVLTLPEMALNILRAVPRREGQEFVFGPKRAFGAWSYGMLALNNRVAAMNGTPLPHWTLHDLRRSMRSGLGKIGVRPDVAELVIGHSKTGIERIYDRYRYAPEIKAALATWANHVTAVVEGREVDSNVVPLRA
jgi:integrase